MMHRAGTLFAHSIQNEKKEREYKYPPEALFVAGMLPMVYVSLVFERFVIYGRQTIRSCLLKAAGQQSEISRISRDRGLAHIAAMLMWALIMLHQIQHTRQRCS